MLLATMTAELYARMADFGYRTMQAEIGNMEICNVVRSAVLFSLRVNLL
jgi:hypothetical protein